MNILVSGSLAYDRIMDFPGKFSDHILPDKVHVLNVCFMINELKENFGVLPEILRMHFHYLVRTHQYWLLPVEILSLIENGLIKIILLQTVLRSSKKNSQPEHILLPISRTIR